MAEKSTAKKTTMSSGWTTTSTSGGFTPRSGRR